MFKMWESSIPFNDLLARLVCTIRAIVKKYAKTAEVHSVVSTHVETVVLLTRI